MRFPLITLLLALQVSVLADEPETKPDPNLRLVVTDWISEYDQIVSICIYEQEWIPPEATRWPQKAILIYRAVVVGVHKGNLPIGTQLELSHTIEDPPKLFKEPFRSTVPGKLEYCFFSDESSKKTKEKRVVLDHSGFSRDDERFSDFFRMELQTNPELNPASEQGGARQPDTAPKSTPKDKGKPKSESKRRSP